MVDNLPPESALKTALRDGMSIEEWESSQAEPGADGWGPWSKEALLLAELIDRIRHVEQAVYYSGSDGKRKPAALEPLPRPGVGPPPRALAQRNAEKVLRSVAFAKALERNHGRRPTPEEVAAVLAELTSG